MLLCGSSSQKHTFADAPPVYEKQRPASSVAPAAVDTTERLRELREQLSDNKIDAYLVPSGDAHGSEYVARKDRRQEFVSGFTGESSMAVISQECACLFVDGRYHVSAGKEIDSNWTLYKVGLKDVPTWDQYLTSLPQGCRVGLDATLFGITEVQSLQAKLADGQQQLVFLEENPVDAVWEDRPSPSTSLIKRHDKWAGESSGSKLAKLRETIGQGHAQAFVVHELSELAWLFNLRGSDIPFSPVFEGYAVITLDAATLFTDLTKIEAEVAEYLKTEAGATLQPYDGVWNAFEALSRNKNKTLLSHTASFAVFSAVGQENVVIVKSPIELAKSIKNDKEIDGMKAAYLRDAVAWAQWMAWLEKRMSGRHSGHLNEWEIAEQLSSLRSRQPLFAGLAYENISATGANAALPHYSATKDSAAIVDPRDVYLNDSGAQYLDGTIDTTRTYHFGKPKPAHRRAYTRVLQGHIHASEANFPAGTSGASIDALARAPLWQDGMNFLHGTGHGIGSYLNVHEGPQRIASVGTEPLRPGQMVSIEPGFYEEGQFGIRIESIYLVKEVKTLRQFGGQWLGFERITQIPIDTRLIQWNLLSKHEAQWIKQHNRACAKAILPQLAKDDRDARRWLKQYL